MSAYTARAYCSQLCSLVLTLGVIALPLAGTKTERAPILVPLGSEPVPLDAGLQSPPDISFQILSVLPSTRLVLVPLRSPALAVDLYSHGRVQATSAGFRARGAIRRPSGRSPPSA